jgi:1-phosphofructokinase family hexose kinase
MHRKVRAGNSKEMIVTVTLNTAIDRTFIIDQFAWNKTIHSSQSVVGMGGKGTDASWILGELGYDNTALGFAAGDVGKQIDRMLRARGSRTDFVWVKGESRTNVIVVSEQGHKQSTLVSGGLEISDHNVAMFKNKFMEAVTNAGCVVIGGSIPIGLEPSIYTEIVRAARALKVPVIFDSSGPSLQAGLEGKPDFAKPNIDEIAQLSGERIKSIRSAFSEAKRLQEKYGTSFIITLGELGALAVLHHRAYRIPPLKIKVVSTAGAGDGVLAGLAAAISQGKPVEEGLQLGFAIASAVCLTPATADFNRQDVEMLLPRIQLIPYP